jgi:hypothetical protein
MNAEDVLKAVQDCTCNVKQRILNHTSVEMYQILCNCYQERGLKFSSKWTAVVITKVPDTICAVLSPLFPSDNRKHIFLLFDSNPRPSLGIQGGYIWFCDLFLRSSFTKDYGLVLYILYPYAFQELLHTLCQ